MAIYKLLEDVGDAAFALIAIHSQEEDYRLAYQFNAAIATHFSHSSIVVENHQQHRFNVYEWEDKHMEHTWYLVANIAVREDVAKNAQSLFAEQGLLKAYLVPEMKKVDYFIKINNIDQFFTCSSLIEELMKVSGVVTAYEVDPHQLKSKNNLIF